ncbi:TPA: hypothetical protein L5C56_006480 [Pseudomonas aeruginosa]|nr:hypothetical protein [Pseudomonas aeruginosa]
MQEMQHPQLNPDLENKSAFVQRRESFGIPTKIWVGVMGMGLIALFGSLYIFGVWLGLLVGTVMCLVITMPVFMIHKEDPDAWIFWLQSLTAPDFLDPCRFDRRMVGRKRRILLLSWNGNDPVIGPAFTEKE